MAIRGAKSFASLGAGLLARSGTRRVPLSFVPAWPDHGVHDAAQEFALPDVAHVNDDAVIAPDAALPEVVLQVLRLSRAIAAGSPETVAAAPALANAAGRPKAFTLRLDADHHRRLRAIAAAERRSAQRVLIDALAAYDHQTYAKPAADDPAPATPSSLRRTMTGTKP